MREECSDDRIDKSNVLEDQEGVGTFRIPHKCGTKTKDKVVQFHFVLFTVCDDFLDKVENDTEGFDIFRWKLGKDWLDEGRILIFFVGSVRGNPNKGVIKTQRKQRIRHFTEEGSVGKKRD